MQQLILAGLALRVELRPAAPSRLRAAVAPALSAADWYADRYGRSKPGENNAFGDSHFEYDLATGNGGIAELADMPWSTPVANTALAADNEERLRQVAIDVANGVDYIEVRLLQRRWGTYAATLPCAASTATLLEPMRTEPATAICSTDAHIPIVYNLCLET